MNNFKKGFLLLITFVYGSVLFAQNIEDGKKLFFYERYQSAKTFFNQLVTANPNNLDAVYWLGQSEIALDDTAAAQTLYQNALMANSNNALLLAGMGHVALLQNKGQDARQRFETAISLSQGKSIPVLNAIGFANVNAKSGDANYAIDKLKQATTIKGFKDPDVYINLGDAYRKIIDGGLAQGAYENAMLLNGNYARSPFKIGRIYESQGPTQEEIFMKYYNDAIAKDPTFGPVYYALYSYFYKRDVNKSKDYLDKYIANSDPDPKECYYLASILYASSLFQQSIDTADKCISQAGANPYPNLFGLKAYAYDKLADSAKAKRDSAAAKKDFANSIKDSATEMDLAANSKKFFDLYFAKQKPDNIEHGDYTAYAKNLLKFKGNDSLAGTYVDKAISLDTTEADKIADATGMVNYYTQIKDSTHPAGYWYNLAGNWYNKIIGFKKQPLKGDYQSAGFFYYRSGNFVSAAGVFDSAIQKFPDDLYSYYILSRSLSGIDTTMEQGLANASFQKVIDLASADSVKNKAQLMVAYKYFIAYYINIKKDKVTSLQYCDRALALDPTDKEVISYKEIISKANLKSSPSKQSKQ
jgi:Flp pilus assembly protein TadD